MNKKLFFVSVLLVLVPYLALFAVATVFFSSKLPFFKSIMENVFCNNAWHLIAALLICYLLILVLDVIYFFASIHKKWDSLSVARAAMIIKLVQIPAYVSIFILGVLLLISIFTIPFTIALFLVDCLSVFMTGLLVISSVITATRSNTLAFKQVFWVILLQFIFCADVVASVVFYVKLKRSKEMQK